MSVLSQKSHFLGNGLTDFAKTFISYRRNLLFDMVISTVASITIFVKKKKKKKPLNLRAVLLLGHTIHRDPIKMHPFCLGLYFRNRLSKMKYYFIIIIGRVLSFIGEIPRKICRGVLEKSRIL